MNTKETIRDIMNTKEIKKMLQTDGTVFTVRGIDHVTKNTPIEFVINEFDDGAFSFSKNALYAGDGMNIEKFGNTRFYCFTYTVLGRKVKDHVNYEDVTIKWSKYDVDKTRRKIITKGYKIEVNSPEESKRVQDIFFKLGGKWRVPTKTGKYEFTEKRCLYFDEFKNISFSDDAGTFFDEQEETEVTLHELEYLARSY